MTPHDLTTRRALLTTAGATTLALLGLPDLLAQECPPEETRPGEKQAILHIHPHLLQPNDQVSLGPRGSKAITIESPTLLIWVDQMPGARFAHPTRLVLISAEGAQVQKGDWWPSLNGQALFRQGGETRVTSPLVLEKA